MGLITAGRVIAASDLPEATSSAIGAVVPGSGLSVASGGTLNHTNSTTAGTFTKVTVDAQGHVTSAVNLLLLTSQTLMQQRSLQALSRLHDLPTLLLQQPNWLTLQSPSLVVLAQPITSLSSPMVTSKVSSSLTRKTKTFTSIRANRSCRSRLSAATLSMLERITQYQPAEQRHNCWFCCWLYQRLCTSCACYWQPQLLRCC